MNNLYTSIDIKGGLGNQLFQIAYIIYFLRLSKRQRIKRKLVFKSDEDLEPNTLKLQRKTYWNTLFKGSEREDSLCNRERGKPIGYFN